MEERIKKMDDSFVAFIKHYGATDTDSLLKKIVPINNANLEQELDTAAQVGAQLDVLAARMRGLTDYFRYKESVRENALTIEMYHEDMNAPKKRTQKVMEAFIEADPEMVKIRRCLLSAKERLYLLEALSKAWSQRACFLRDNCQIKRMQ